MPKFKINNSLFGKLTQYSLINEDTGEKATIVSDYGCNTRELFLQKNYRLYPVIQGHNIYAKLKKKPSTGAMLCPFVNRIKDGIYEFNQKKYSLNINKKNEHNAIHGLVYDKIFELKKKIITDKFAALVFEHEIKEEDSKGYPFNLLIVKRFELSNSGLKIETRVMNIGNNPAPFGEGWHPHITTGNLIDDDYLLIDSTHHYTNTSRMIVDKKSPNNDTTDFRKFKKIQNTKLDNCFSNLNFDKYGLYKTFLKSKEVEICVWQDKHYPFVQVYTPNNRKSIAIEPMTSTSDSFNNSNGLIVLKPLEEFTGSYGIFIN